MDGSTKATIHDALVKRRAAQFAFLKSMVRLDTSNPPGDQAKAAEKVATMLEGLGFEVTRLKVPKDLAQRRGLVSVTNLIAKRVFGDGPTIALVTALDAPPAGEDWTHDPYDGEIADGVIFGRGLLTGKADLAAYAYAVRGLVDAAAPLIGTVELHVSFDGTGALGAKWLLDENLTTPNLAICAGPARAIAAHSMGTLQLDVEVRGRAAPSHAPERGIDALEGANRIVTLLHQYRAALASRKSKIAGIRHPTLVIEEFYAGSEVGGVPAGARFRVDRRLMPDEDATQVESQLTTMIGTSAAKTPGLRCRIRRTRLIPAMQPTDVGRPLIAAIAQHAKDCTGEAPGAVGVGFDVEARHYSAAGIPTVLYGAGPVDPTTQGMNGPEERLNLDDLRVGTEVVALSLADLLAPRPVVPAAKQAPKQVPEPVPQSAMAAKADAPVNA